MFAKYHLLSHIHTQAQNNNVYRGILSELQVTDIQSKIINKLDGLKPGPGALIKWNENLYIFNISLVYIRQKTSWSLS